MEEKKRPGRKPRSPEEKAAIKMKKDVEKAKGPDFQPVITLQFQGGEITTEAIMDAVIMDFRSVKQRTKINKLDIYVKPEDGAAYYVADNGFTGSIKLKSK